MTIEESYVVLGQVLGSVAGSRNTSEVPSSLKRSVENLLAAVEDASRTNPWFILPFVQESLKAWSRALQPEKVYAWLKSYGPVNDISPKIIGVVMAGNIPMVGLHDLLCVVASGHHLMAKLSGADDRLIPAVAEVLKAIRPETGQRISFTGGIIGDVDAMIATGSNNTARYLEYYFSRFPHIIRRNRNGLAVLTGEENSDQLSLLADDIFLYFGLGCRNVSKIYIPKDFDLERLMAACGKFTFLADHSKYRNNYDYQKSIMMINRVFFNDNGFLLAREAGALASPVSVVHFDPYQDILQVREQLSVLSSEIQCIVTDSAQIEEAVRFGQSQYPGLSDYADGIDTMAFLRNLNLK